jgi:CRISPR/Cas system-associated endonuclease/helicase Cas3
MDQYPSILSQNTVAFLKKYKLKWNATRWNLEANGIGADGAGHLAEALKVNTTLTELDLKQNNITEIRTPFSMTCQVDLDYHKLVYPLLNFKQFRDNTSAQRAIVEYFERSEQGSTLLTPRRLMIIGEGGAGKTTLRTALALKDLDGAPNESLTDKWH